MKTWYERYKDYFESSWWYRYNSQRLHELPGERLRWFSYLYGDRPPFTMAELHVPRFPIVDQTSIRELINEDSSYMNSVENIQIEINNIGTANEINRIIAQNAFSLTFSDTITSSEYFTP